ncbi:MAG: hypothetical protein CMD96_08205 [Gammaproteobacteria bacterium]|nr:hypothetical protein [Gammaproteobacteria bacterium]
MEDKQGNSNKSPDQEFLQRRAGRIEDLDRLQHMGEFKSLKWYFEMVAEKAIMELVTVKNLTMKQEERLKAKIEICKFEFANIGSWLKNEDDAAREMFEDLEEIKNLT